jgi:hypothetical protein
VARNEEVLPAGGAAAGVEESVGIEAGAELGISGVAELTGIDAALLDSLTAEDEADGTSGVSCADVDTAASMLEDLATSGVALAFGFGFADDLGAGV